MSLGIWLTVCHGLVLLTRGIHESFRVYEVFVAFCCVLLPHGIFICMDDNFKIHRDNRYMPRDTIIKVALKQLFRRFSPIYD